jgi:hypothetical protein
MDWRSWDRAISDPGLLQLIAYWEKKRESGFAPSRRSIDPLDFVFVLGDVALIEVLHEPLRFRYRLYGTKMARRSQVDLTGRLTDDIAEPIFRQSLREILSEICETRRPWTGRGSRLMPHGSGRFEAAILPLSEDGTTINMMLSCWRWMDEPA